MMEAMTIVPLNLTLQQVEILCNALDLGLSERDPDRMLDASLEDVGELYDLLVTTAGEFTDTPFEQDEEEAGSED